MEEDPTEEEILAACEALRATWSPAKLAFRSSGSTRFPIKQHHPPPKVGVTVVSVTEIVYAERDLRACDYREGG